MTESLSKLFSDLDLDLVRIRRPSKVVFFCGGAMAGRSSAAPGVESLRNYLINTCEIRSKISGEIVLAEGATTLYRDSGYHDLISFEEDIARLSAIILVIAESPGSLAELGAFASNDTIRKKLAIIVEHIHYDAESFIRFGPIERLRLENDSRVAVFSWESQLKNPSFGDRKNVDTQEMIDFINNLTKNTPNEELYRVDAEFQE